MADVIVDEIDRLHGDVERLQAEFNRANGPERESTMVELGVAFLKFNTQIRGTWPALRDRLREAEQYKADSADRLVQMVEERSRLERRLALAEKALEVKEQLNETLRRCCDEAKAKLKEAGHG